MSTSSETTAPKKKEKGKKKGKKKTVKKKEEEDKSEDFLKSLQISETEDLEKSSESIVHVPGKNEKEESWGRWALADIEPIRVRSAKYLYDQKKIAPSGFHFDLVHVEIFSATTRLSNVAARPDSYVSKRASSLRDRLCFVVNWQVPGTPECNWVTYFQYKTKDDGFDLNKDIKAGIAAREAKKKKAREEEEDEEEEEEEEEETPSPSTPVAKDDHSVFARTLTRFFSGDDHYRHNRFKFIPRIVEGNWLVQRAVGSTPAILGTKMTQTYHHDAKLNYFEVDVDVGSSSIAKSILNLVRGYAKSIAIDCFFLIEGKKSDELPEQIIGGVRLSNVDHTKFPEVKPLKKTKS